MPTIQEAKAAAQQGNPQQARLLFEAILQANSRSEEAWVGLAEVLTEIKEKRICYENALKINKKNKAAKDGLRNLEPQSNPLIAALGNRTASQPDDDAAWLDPDQTMIDGGEASLPPSSEQDEETKTPLGILVAVGLALSVVLFAIGGGIVFMIISSLAAP